MKVKTEKDKLLDRIISRFPIGIFLFTVIADVISTNVGMVSDNYSYAFYYMAEIFHTSIVANVFFLYIIRKNKLCLYNKVAVFGLLTMNLVNVMVLTFDDYGDSLNYDLYCSIFTHAVMIPTAILSLILMFKKI